jgi:hypothetical protein
MLKFLAAIIRFGRVRNYFHDECGIRAVFTTPMALRIGREPAIASRLANIALVNHDFFFPYPQFSATLFSNAVPKKKIPIHYQ